MGNIFSTPDNAIVSTYRYWILLPHCLSYCAEVDRQPRCVALIAAEEEKMPRGVGHFFALFFVSPAPASSSMDQRRSTRVPVPSTAYSAEDWTFDSPPQQEPHRRTQANRNTGRAIRSATVDDSMSSLLREHFCASAEYINFFWSFLLGSC